MRCVKSLSAEEVEALERLYRYSPRARVRQRAHMVLLSSQRRSVTEVAQIVRASTRTVSCWLTAYEQFGVSGLYDRPIPGRPSSLSPEQLSQVKSWVQGSPRDQGYSTSNWTCRLLRHHIWQQFKVSLSQERVRQILHQLGFVLVRPRHRSSQANPEAQKSPGATQGTYRFCRKGGGDPL